MIQILFRIGKSYQGRLNVSSKYKGSKENKFITQAGSGKEKIRNSRTVLIFIGDSSNTVRR